MKEKIKGILAKLFTYTNEEYIPLIIMSYLVVPLAHLTFFIVL